VGAFLIFSVGFFAWVSSVIYLCVESSMWFPSIFILSHLPPFSWPFVHSSCSNSVCLLVIFFLPALWQYIHWGIVIFRALVSQRRPTGKSLLMAWVLTVFPKCGFLLLTQSLYHVGAGILWSRESQDF
jgi:hypothetical protein